MKLTHALQKIDNRLNSRDEIKRLIDDFNEAAAARWLADSVLPLIEEVEAQLPELEAALTQAAADYEQIHAETEAGVNSSDGTIRTAASIQRVEAKQRKETTFGFLSEAKEKIRLLTAARDLFLSASEPPPAHEVEAILRAVKVGKAD